MFTLAGAISLPTKQSTTVGRMGRCTTVHICSYFIKLCCEFRKIKNSNVPSHGVVKIGSMELRYESKTSDRL